MKKKQEEMFALLAAAARELFKYVTVVTTDDKDPKMKTVRAIIMTSDKDIQEAVEKTDWERGKVVLKEKKKKTKISLDFGKGEVKESKRKHAKNKDL